MSDEDPPDLACLPLFKQGANIGKELAHCVSSGCASLQFENDEATCCVFGGDIETEAFNGALFAAVDDPKSRFQRLNVVA